MVETEPMSNFMRESLAKVVVLCGTSRHGRKENDAPIFVELFGIGCSIGGVVGVSKVPFAELVLEVDVEGCIVASAERLLHGEFVTVGGPFFVNCIIRGVPFELDAVWS